MIARVSIFSVLGLSLCLSFPTFAGKSYLPSNGRGTITIVELRHSEGSNVQSNIRDVTLKTATQQMVDGILIGYTTWTHFHREEEMIGRKFWCFEYSSYKVKSMHEAWKQQMEVFGRRVQIFQTVEGGCDAVKETLRNQP